MPDLTPQDWKTALLVLRQVERAQGARTWDTSEHARARDVRHSAPVATALAEQRERLLAKIEKAFPAHAAAIRRSDG